MKLLGIRNHMTEALISQLAPIDAYEMVGDPILSFQTITCNALPAKGDIGVNVIDLPGTQRQEDQLFQAIAGCVHHLIDTSPYPAPKCRVFCFGRDTPCNDEVKALRLANEFLSGTGIEIHPNVQDIFLGFSRLQKLDAFISMRTDPALIAATNGIVPVVLEHRGKRGQEIMDLIRCKQAVVSPYDTNSDQLIDTIQSARSTWRENYMEVKNRVAYWRRKQEQFAAKIFSTLFDI